MAPTRAVCAQFGSSGSRMSETILVSLPRVSVELVANNGRPAPQAEPLAVLVKDQLGVIGIEVTVNPVASSAEFSAGRVEQDGTIHPVTLGANIDVYYVNPSNYLHPRIFFKN